MKLSIDSTDHKVVIITLNDQVFSQELLAHHRPQTLVAIDSLLKQQAVDVSLVTEAFVAIGPGSFTGTRVGVAIANALALALRIPVNGLSLGQFAVPEYDQLPHISRPI